MKITADSVKNRRLAEGQVGVWYLGQESILFKSGGQYLTVDPYLSDYVDQYCCQFVQWRRRYAPPMMPAELGFVHAVLCTHSHYDHADPVTLTAIAAANPRTVFVIPAPEVDTVAGYGIPRERILPARADEAIVLGGFTVTPIPAAHEELHTDANGDYRELSYIIETAGQRFFHGGDMCLYDGLAARLTDIDIAFLPINGRDYYRNKNDIIGNTDCAEAVTLAKEIGAGMLVPMHHDLYDVNGVHPAVFVNAVYEIDPGRRYHIFAPGEGYVSVKD